MFYGDYMKFGCTKYKQNVLTMRGKKERKKRAWGVKINHNYLSSSLDSSDDEICRFSATFSEFRRRIFFSEKSKDCDSFSPSSPRLSGELGGVSAVSCSSSSSDLGVFDSELPEGTRRRGEDWDGIVPLVRRGLNIPESVSVVSVITHSSSETSKLEIMDDWHETDPCECLLEK